MTFSVDSTEGKALVLVLVVLVVVAIVFSRSKSKAQNNQLNTSTSSDIKTSVTGKNKKKKSKSNATESNSSPKVETVVLPVAAPKTDVSNSNIVEKKVTEKVPEKKVVVEKVPEKKVTEKVPEIVPEKVSDVVQENVKTQKVSASNSGGSTSKVIKVDEKKPIEYSYSDSYSDNQQSGDSGDEWSTVKRNKKAVNPLPTAPTSAAVQTTAVPTTANTAPISVAPVTPVEKEVIIKSTVTIDAKSVGKIVGPKGANIQAIKKVTNVDVSVPKDREDSSNAQVVVSLSGKSDESIKNATKAITDLASKGYSSVLEGPDFKEGSIEITVKAHREVTGKDFTHAKKIENEFGVRIKSDDGAKEAKGLRRVFIAGPKQKVKAAKELIKSMNTLYYSTVTHGSDFTHVIMDVPSTLCGRIVGQKGANIKHIQASYKVQVHMPDEETDGIKKVIIVGTLAQVNHAQNYIQTKFIDQPKPSEAENVDVEPASFDINDIQQTAGFNTNFEFSSQLNEPESLSVDNSKLTRINLTWGAPQAPGIF